MKPILFSTPMVQAILDGRKTQTRRVINLYGKQCDSYKIIGENSRGKQYEFCINDSAGKIYAQPRYCVGDVLWVRETCAMFEGASGRGYIYKADHRHVVPLESCISDRWKPSIHMPKEAARIFLRVTEVRCERLNDITVKDCIAEGIGNDCFTSSEIEEHFKQLWQEINGERKYGNYAWEKNPWVWVYEFERIDGNVLKAATTAAAESIAQLLLSRA